MNFSRSLAFTAALVAVFFGAFSASASAATARITHLPFETLETLLGQPGESMDAFVVRIGPDLRKFADKTGFEACGLIARAADGTFGVVLTSSRSHVGCVVQTASLPAGMVATDQTIHCHGTDGRRSSMNRADRALLGVSDSESGLGFVPTQNLSHFSPTDYAGGAGFLATPTGVLHQDGTPGSEREVQPTRTVVAVAPAE